MAGVGIKRAMIGNIHHDREARTGPVKTISAQWRAASSAGHIYGKKRIYAEAFTSSLDHEHHPYLIKARGEELFCEGINHFVLTLYSHQPRTGMPGKNPWYGTAFHRNTPWFNKAQSWVKYLQRVHFMLQQGEPVADVAVYIGDFAPQMSGPENPIPPGYDFDYISSDVILNRLQVVDGQWVVPAENDAGRIAARYQLLAMPELKVIRPEVKASLDQLVEKGGKLIGSVPVGPETMRQLGIAPIVSDTTQPIRWKHRQTADTDIFFVSNFQKASVFSATFRSKGRGPEIFDPVSGEVKTTAWFKDVQNGTSTEFTVKNSPGDQVLRDPWNITFDASNGTAEKSFFGKRRYVDGVGQTPG